MSLSNVVVQTNLKEKRNHVDPSEFLSLRNVAQKTLQKGSRT